MSIATITLLGLGYVAASAVGARICVAILNAYAKIETDNAENLEAWCNRIKHRVERELAPAPEYKSHLFTGNGLSQLATNAASQSFQNAQQAQNCASFNGQSAMGQLERHMGGQAHAFGSFLGSSNGLFGSHFK